MSIRVKREFDITMEIIDEMERDIIDNKPHHISIIAGNVPIVFDDVTVTLYNGFLKVIDDDAISVIRYRDITGYSISKLSSIDDDAGDVDEFDDDAGDVDEFDDDADVIWQKIVDTPSTLNQEFLSRDIPSSIKKEIIISYLCDYEGLNRKDVLSDWMDRVNDWMDNNKTYGDLNETLRDNYMWFFLTPDVIADRLRDGDVIDASSHHSRNIISEYSSLMGDDADLMGDDADE